MPRVFIPNQPLKYDRVSGQLVKGLDLSAAESFGNFIFLTPDGELQGTPEDIVSQMRAQLQSFTPLDYLLLVGDPRAISWASAIAADVVDGDLRLLHWARSEHRYRVVQTALFEVEDA